MTRQKLLEKITDEVYGCGGYHRFSDSLRIMANDGGDDFPINIIALAIIADNESPHEVKMLDMNYFMWSVDDFCTDESLEKISKAFQKYPIEHVVFTRVEVGGALFAEYNDTVLEYQDDNFVALTTDGNGEVVYESYRSLERAEKFLERFHNEQRTMKTHGLV